MRWFQRSLIARTVAVFSTGGAAALLGYPIVAHSQTPSAALRTEALKQFAPLPKTAATKDAPVTPARVTLGHLLFFEPRVSLDGTTSCSRCHLPQLAGTDGLPVSIGVQNRANAHNAPTVFNAALQTTEHWRGDRTSVEDQATRALLGPASFGNLDPAVPMQRLRDIEEYRRLFQQAFPEAKEPVTPENWGKAIGAYERTLLTPAPFDALLTGKGALSPAAEHGLRDFMQLGCASCHDGVGVGGHSFEKFGVVEDYWPATGSKVADKGREDVTHAAADRYFFKVPSLRNVASTPPYFHDGSVATLADAVRVMGRVQLGKTLEAEQVANVVAFLESLSGKPVGDAFSVPALPVRAFSR